MIIVEGRLAWQNLHGRQEAAPPEGGTDCESLAAPQYQNSPGRSRAAGRDLRMEDVKKEDVKKEEFSSTTAKRYVESLKLISASTAAEIRIPSMGASGALHRHE